MRYGYFDDERREYVITQADTPLPWINYLGNETYFGLISNTAGGYSFFKDASLRRITRYRYNNVPYDFGGRYIYLRDNSTNKFWSPTWQPVRISLDKYECRHGLGYTIIKSKKEELEAEVTYFVPLKENLEIWKLSLKNHRNESADLSIFSSIEFCLWNAQDDSTNFQRNLNIGEVEIENGVIYHKTGYRERRNHFSYFACSEKVQGYDTQREAFLGAYGDWKSPLAVVKGRSFNSQTTGWTPIGSHFIKINLYPNEEREIIFLVGYHENKNNKKFVNSGSQIINKKTVKQVIQKFLKKENVN
ncbi:MAG: glycosyl transferase, partial [Candidatus Hodarchaeota archaeon]